MAWGANGVTVKRRLIDQSQVVAWGNSPVRVNTKAFNQVGYLSRLRIKVPIQAGTLTVGAGVSVAAQPAAQRAAHRAIQSMDITAQGISPFYQLTKGADLAFLEWFENGKERWKPIGVGKAVDAPANALGSLGLSSASLAAIAYDVAAASVSAGSQNVQYSAMWDVPLTETVRFPEYVQQTQNGVVTVPAQEVEVGLITLQNTQQNVTPHLTLNPLYSGTVDSPFLQTGGAPTGSVNTLVEFYTEFYDVPMGAENQPPGYSQLFIISRTSTDDGVTAGAVTHTFAPAGLLLAAIYTFYDTNDALVDVSNQGVQAIGTYPLPAQVQEAQMSFAWGSTVYKSTERISVNLASHFENYGEPPPLGCAAHDFFRDRTVTEVINTAALPSVRAIFGGLPTAITNLHTIEKRMIPVRLG